MDKGRDILRPVSNGLHELLDIGVHILVEIRMHKVLYRGPEGIFGIDKKSFVAQILSQTPSMLFSPATRHRRRQCHEVLGTQRGMAAMDT